MKIIRWVSQNFLKTRSQEELAFRKMTGVSNGRHTGLSSRVQPTITELTKQREVIKVSSVGEKSFSVVSYNILADCHMEPEWYQYTPDDSRTAQQRHSKLMGELDVLNGDIICLQEVGEDYQPFLTSEMADRGYKGEYFRKTMGTREGSATFFKRDEFEFFDVQKLTFNEMLEEAMEAENIDVSAAASCARDHIFLIVQLRHLKSGKVLTIGNIHTIWDNFSQLDVTTLQVALALAKLVRFAEDSTYIMAGDFNSRQNMAPYYLLLNGALSESHKKELAAVATMKHDNKSLFELLENYYQHSSEDLSSSYLSLKGTEPDLTNYDDYDGQHPADWCLDYIWYTSNTLEANCVLDTIGTPSSRIPNEVFPSDHLSLKTTFSFNR
eukprot:TRINITY_DN22262_c0_g1_i1.p1 TRINITY_DN22262_c0_g1~~TRINITY_DN22262_c0_g1_i1.p1  ORF type:complete len:382 (-),score=109.82 TRINITY_DN22262_c0_g1_i1:211-1356(-)